MATTTYDFYIRRGDTSPSLNATLTDDTGAPIDLTGCTVYLNCKRSRQASRPALVRECEIISYVGGEIRYTMVDADWVGDDPFVAELYDIEFEIVNPSWRLTVPTVGAKSMLVSADLA